ncbi:MAG TPA: hypothetical protein VL093_12410 [Flavipsychrobacter sp.]|nr:hypothetical protein [Flavipsychrobacter sp.]
MEDRKKHIDDLFREGLNDYREVPDDRVWSALEQRLTEADASATEKPSRRWLWLLLLLLLLGTIGYFVLTNSAEKADHQKDINRKGHASATNVAISNEASAGINVDSFNANKKRSSSLAISGNSNHQALHATAAAGNLSGTNSNADRTGNHSVGRTVSDRKTAVPHERNRYTRNKAANSGREEELPATNSNSTENEARAANTSRQRNSNGKRRTVTDASASSSSRLSSDNTISESRSASGNTMKNEKGARNADNNKATASRQQKTTGKKTTAGPGREKKPLSNQNASNKTASNGNNSSKTSTGKSTLGATNGVAATGVNPEPSKAERQTAVPTYNKENSPATATENHESNQSLVEKEALAESGLYVPPAERKKAKPYDSKQALRRKSKLAENSDEGSKNPSIDGIEDEGEPITVLAATGSKGNVVVNPASFASKQPDDMNPAKFKKSKLIVTTTEPAVKTTEEEKSLSNKPKKEEQVKGEEFTVANEEEKPEKTENARMYLATSKSEVPVATTTDNSGGGGGGTAVDVRPAKPKANQFRFDLGVKAGYEKGFADVTSSSFIFAPFLQWNISPHVSFVLQPGFRYNQVNRTDIFNMTATYHQITSATRDSFNNYITDTSGQTTDVQRNYLYKQVYDSIVFNRRLAQKNYWEIELPIMLRYKIASNFAIFGGLSLTFGNLLKLDDGKTVFSGLQKSDSLSFPTVPINAPGPTLPGAAGYFPYNTPDISTAPAASVTPTSNPARFGIMFGFSYELQRRIMIDVMYKQTVSDMRYIPNEQMRKIYTQPYFRVMLGLKLFESKKPVVANPAGL